MEKFQEELKELLEKYNKTLIPVLNIEIRDMPSSETVAEGNSTTEPVVSDEVTS